MKELPGALFLSPGSKNKKKITSKESSYIFEKLNFLAQILRHFKYFHIFQETELFYISGNKNPEKLIFQEVTFQARKSPLLKSFLYFGK